MPVMTALRSSRRPPTVTRSPAVGLEERQPDVVVVVEHDAHRHADVHVVGLGSRRCWSSAAGPPARRARRWRSRRAGRGRDPRLMVDRERVHHRPPRHRLGRDVLAAGTSGRSARADGSSSRSPGSAGSAARRRRRRARSARCRSVTRGRTRNGLVSHRRRHLRLGLDERSRSKPLRACGSASTAGSSPNAGWVSMIEPDDLVPGRRRPRRRAWRGATRPGLRSDHRAHHAG